MRSLFAPLALLLPFIGQINAQLVTPRDTQPLTLQGDLSAQMVSGIDRFLMQATEATVTEREKLWRRDFSSPAAYEASISTNRARFRARVGAIDNRLPVSDLEYVSSIDTPARIA